VRAGSRSRSFFALRTAADARHEEDLGADQSYARGVITERPSTTLPADLVASVAFEVKELLERHQLAPLRAELIGLRREVAALRDERSRRLLQEAAAV
jgi:hypothetical protein